MDFPKVGFKYVFSLITVTTLLVYIIDLPTLITQESALVKEYYVKNYFTHFLLDVILIAIYLGISHYFMDLFQISDKFMQFVFVALVTACISGLFYIYFITSPKSSTFFSRWFHTVKSKAILYDMVLVSSVFFVYRFFWKDFL